ncbi:hypothetical protein B0H13DRAFT_1970776 [Mycena leptocephala]|nr:hypothetical protein B0H13DRAFT_1970776 [Mycena leptocephala]
MALAILLAVTVVGLLMAEMAVMGIPTALTVFVNIWAPITITILIVLLYMGRRHHSRCKLGRTVTQIRVLCALAFSRFGCQHSRDPLGPHSGHGSCLAPFRRRRW